MRVYSLISLTLLSFPECVSILIFDEFVLGQMFQTYHFYMIFLDIFSILERNRTKTLKIFYKINQQKKKCSLKFLKLNELKQFESFTENLSVKMKNLST